MERNGFLLRDEHQDVWTLTSMSLVIPYIKRGVKLRYEMPHIPYSSESFIALRPYYVHGVGSPFQIAAMELDYEMARECLSRAKLPHLMQSKRCMISSS